MLPGDALAVASEIARGVGLPNIRRVADLKAAGARAGNEAVDLLAGADGFAEVYPEDKYGWEPAPRSSSPCPKHRNPVRTCP
jgi:H+-transporting ATPase